MEDNGPASESPTLAWLKRNINWLILGFALVFIVLPRVSPWEGLNENLSFFRRFGEWMLAKLESLFANYGYWVVFLGVLAENTLFFGFIVPGSVILILGGLSAENGSINLWYVLALGVAGTIIGDTASYFIGRLGWSRALERGGAGRMIEKIREPMEKNSTWLILAYHFAGYSRVVGPTAAGLFRIPYRRWAPLDYIGGTVWVLAFLALGYVVGLFGVDFGDTKRMVQLLELMFLALLVVAIVVAYTRTARLTQEVGGAGDVQPAPPHGRHAAPVIVPVEED